jgi:hypothetical protein
LEEELVLCGLEIGETWAPPGWCSEEALWLARGLLALKADERLTPAEALNHPFLVPACF